ncbi:DUF1062 domain-containing protein [Roseibium hamelinense]|nr:DUF1062 domain-containing protein [Roseibium hamelinense]
MAKCGPAARLLCVQKLNCTGQPGHPFRAASLLLVDFQMEGQDGMSKTLSIGWTVLAKNAPRPRLNCGRCGKVQSFHSSGKIRLNANGRKLDAWLVYKCTHCNATWNRPVIERIPINTLSKSYLTALETSDETMVRRFEFEVGGLAYFTHQIEWERGLLIQRHLVSPMSEDWSSATILIRTPVRLHIRVERLMSYALDISRADCRNLFLEGGMKIRRPSGQQIWRGPVKTEMEIDVQRCVLKTSSLLRLY